jgi:Tol biopolymer transport system component
VIEGDKTDEFEAFHLFQSKMDISREGKLAFVSKSGENDALHLYDVKNDRLLNSYHFKDLVVIGSPSWAPDGKRLVLSAVDKSGNNDLYVWDTEKEILNRLFNDPYDDRDPSWSPDGKRIVFSSDRNSFGIRGKYNLFMYDFEKKNISYLTYGDAIYSSPVWSADGRALLFTCDESGSRNIWMMRFDSSDAAPKTMRRLTSFTTAAFDPAWADSSMVFAAFEDFSYQLRRLDNAYQIYDSSTAIYNFESFSHDVPWTPNSLAGATERHSIKYKGDYSLDIAQSEIATDPVFGTAGGAFLSMSDLLGNEQYYFLLYNTAQSQDELLSSFNIAISRVSLQQRANYAYGVYRFSGRRYDLLVDPDNYFYETDFGGYFALSYPISRFHRIETVTSLSNSERELQTDIIPRQALFLSNSISYIQDNSLWGPSGPVDGSRFMLTLSYTSDVQYSNANYYSAIFDYRRYIYLGGRSAYASRYWLFYNDGKESRRFFMGGSWDLRGYPRFSIRGKKLWLTSQELRFPFLDQLGLRFPFGGISFVGLRGALFFDAGNAWDDAYEETFASTGFGIRMNLGGYLVLRYDFGKRIENNFTTLEKDIFTQFFFGWDF